MWVVKVLTDKVNNSIEDRIKTPAINTLYAFRLLSLVSSAILNV